MSLKTLSPYPQTLESSFKMENGNITHDTELYDDDHYMLLLSGYSRHLEASTKMLSLSLKHFTYFIKKHSLRGYFVDQFLTIL